MLWAKKNSYKEFDNEKKFLRLENSPPPPITFLMVRPLSRSLIDNAEGEIWSSIFNITCKTSLYFIFRDFLKLSLEINEHF